jgi:hypothetical protein
MITRHRLQQEADSSPGGGAAPAPTTAQGTALDGDTLRALTGEIRNAVFAELRRSGALREPASAEKPAPKPSRAEPAGDVEERLAAIQADSVRMRAYDRACASLGLDDDQSAMLESLYRSANIAPEAAREWLGSAVSKLKLAGRTAATPIPNTPTGSPSRSVSDAGAPAQPLAATEDTSALLMSPADRAAFIKQHGMAAFKAKVQRDAKNTRVGIL